MTDALIEELDALFFAVDRFFLQPLDEYRAAFLLNEQLLDWLPSYSVYRTNSQGVE
jgi:hypothetical protein